MSQTQNEITQNLAERLCWEVARRDDTRVARRLYRKQEVDGVYRLDEGAVLDDFFHFLQSPRGDGAAGGSPRRGHPARDGSLCAVCLALRAEDAVRHRKHECPASPVVQR